LTSDGGCGSMFALVKPDLRACTRLLSVAAAARRSQLLLLAARGCCWIWMLMEPARTCTQRGLILSWWIVVPPSLHHRVRSWWSISPPLPTSSYTVVVDRSSPLPVVPRCPLILQLGFCRMLLLLLHCCCCCCCCCCMPLLLHDAPLLLALLCSLLLALL
jgi:hypothetical protein